MLNPLTASLRHQHVWCSKAMHISHQQNSQRQNSTSLLSHYSRRRVVNLYTTTPWNPLCEHWWWAFPPYSWL